MSKIDIVEVLADPSVRYWVKSAINNLLERDPINAYQDASLLEQICRQRMDEALEKAKAKAPKGWECVE